MKTIKQLLMEADFRDKTVSEIEPHIKQEAASNVAKMKFPSDDGRPHLRANAHISSYKLGAGFDVNEALRKHKVKNTEIKHFTDEDDTNPTLAHSVAKDMVKHDQAMHEITRHPTEHEFHVYRGFTGHDLSVNMKKMQPGDTIHDHGYSSTSLDHHVAMKFSNKSPWNHEDHEHVVAKIHIKPGVKGHYLENHPTGVYEHEKEFVLHKGTTFKVTGHSKGELPIKGPGSDKKKVHFIHMEVHHQDE